ncbi:MAG TPA: DUF72 domain-containing protein [Planctomycetota bacterium]|nr:DUF72 domain-containing protein [Planctomycetota bacterium]
MDATTTPPERPRIATAGWQLPAAHRHAFPDDGSNLERYARVFTAVEINSSFYRPHQRRTYERWAASVPPGFRFAVKLPQAISHERAFVGCMDLLDVFLEQCRGLGDRLGPLLIQTPGKQDFARGAMSRFLAGLRRRHAGDVVCEPRNATWFAADAQRVLVDHRVARVAADPARVPAAGEPGGWDGLAYWRLHGSPQMYVSPYAAAYLAALARRLRARDGASWCVFDNTMWGHATANALALQRRCRRRARRTAAPTGG